MSCDKCKSRKQKCDRALGRSQCRYCEINGIVCSTTQPRKQHSYVNDEDLRSRLDLLESLVKGLIPEADLSSNDELQHLGKSLGIPLPGNGHTPRVEGSEKGNDGASVDQESAASLLPDQQGHVQYIGPSSSFAFHNKLRMLMGSYTSREFAMFGHNAADVTAGSVSGPKPQIQPFSMRQSRVYQPPSPMDYRSILRAMGDEDGSVLNTLVDTYFDIIHPDFPVLHEASFREDYELWASASSTTRNTVWLCTLFCVLILSRRVTPLPISEPTEHLFWAHVQTLLPTVLFTTNIHTVQSLLLAALHLHNNNHRDACWNLTGAALHVAIAMGLHRDDIKHAQTPFQRELRKQLWWTLVAFEKMQVSSYDRPSGISDTVCSASYPNERLVGCAGHYPQGYLKHWQQLVALLGSACKAISTVKGAEDYYSYGRPLSPVSAIIRDLARWKKGLPSHLRLEAVESLPLASKRPVLLLHAKCAYVTILVSKSALLHQASMVVSAAAAAPSGRGNNASLALALRTVAETCIEAGQTLGRVMVKLNSMGKLNPFTWWDTFYAMNAALVLTLDILYRVRDPTPLTSTGTNPGTAEDSLALLHELKDSVSKHLQNPLVPGSMRAWGVIVVDLGTLSAQWTQPVVNSETHEGGFEEGSVCVAAHEDVRLGLEQVQGNASASPIEAITLEHFNLLHTSFELSQFGHG
ncbi:fungal-specific transcription factor domain-containing protein [Aspergillus heterothallicus]